MRERQRLNITLSKENYEFLKKVVPNASRFIDGLIDSVKTQMHPATVLMMTPEQEQIAQPAQPATTVQPMQPRQTTYQITLKELYRQYKIDFDKWLDNKVSKGSKRDYINAIEKNLTDDIKTPKELSALIPVSSKYLAVGIRNFLNFLEDEEIEEINGYSLDRWRKVLTIKKSGVKEVYITDKELLEAYEASKCKDVFRLLVYSGMRLRQIERAIRNIDESLIVTDGAVSRYPISEISKGQKKGFWLYFPTSFKRDFINIKTRGYDALVDCISHKRVSAKTIRKWNMNFLIEQGVSESIVDFIQGRAAVTVGSAHYLNKTKQADREYAKVLDKFPL
jgi:intergrase/recombinase